MNIKFSGVIGIISIAAMSYGCYIRNFAMGWLWLYVGIASLLYAIALIFQEDEFDLDYRFTSGANIAYGLIAYGVYIKPELALWAYIVYFVCAVIVGMCIPFILFRSRN
jgi:hypothetical protein